jgi:hypothetical protein
LSQGIKTHLKDATNHTSFPETQARGERNTPAMVRYITVFRISQ